MDKPRTIEAVKNDIRSRIGRRAPFLHADPEEAEEALARLQRLRWRGLGSSME